MSTSAFGSVGLSANMFEEPRFLLDAFAKRDFGLALPIVSIVYGIWNENNALHDMLVAVGAQLCCAGRHDVVAGRDVCWLAPTWSVSNHSLRMRAKAYLSSSSLDWRTWRWYSMLLISDFASVAWTVCAAFTSLSPRTVEDISAYVLIDRCLIGGVVEQCIDCL